MNALIASVLATSLLGSAHCAGMCGGFVTLACGSGASHARMSAAYNLGRLAIYITLGALAGAVGSLVNVGSISLGIQRGAALLAGSTMVLFGLCLLAQEWGAYRVLPTPPAFLQNLYVSAVARLQQVTPTTRAFSLGLLSATLPCGWLYAFLFVAAGTGHALTGMLSMAAFWLGTLPALVLIGTLLRRIQSQTLVNMRRALPALLVAVGLLTCFSRGTVHMESLELARASTESQAQHVLRIAAETPACCKTVEATR